MESSSSEITSVFGLFSVPLKSICSMKWESPASLSLSYLEPTPTMTVTVTVLVPFIGMVMIRRPFFNVVFL